MLVDRSFADAVVLALPRGGVPVGFEVATALRAPLDVFVVRKVGAPHQPEMGIGAVAEGGTEVVDRRLLRAVGVSDETFAELADRERVELQRRVTRYRGARPLPDVAGRDVVLVDDGLATGVTAEAALLALRAGGPRALHLAVPACAAESAERLRQIADDVVCVTTPSAFRAVGEWYDVFDQTTDDEVTELLERAGRVVDRW
ncbi:phosphoribosyltransferase [Iamia sp.]|uniref:phosphoribosyltransferase n=1 Tax=Iamia sp. TaxID=2722710 RepID=UPI002BA68EE6|nr:phosphoribosyltransferase family protein [Iamia sp.]HXH56534.1 phosphoribosyltransferase family protein [Iamia sp.]